MIILGIDPGTTRVGYGLVDLSGNKFKLISAGLLKIDSDDKNKRLYQLEKSLTDILKKHKPEVAGVEKIYFVKNIKTGIEVAQARGVIMLSLIKNNIPTKEMTPLEVKMGISGYGKSDKKSVSKMVAQTLGLKKLEVIDDVSDALAIAIISGRMFLFDKLIK